MTSQPDDSAASMRQFEEATDESPVKTGFLRDLFAGVFRWDLVSPFPEQDSEDKRIGDDLLRQVRKILEEYVDPNEVDRTGEAPEESLLALAEVGCFGMRIPKAYGGMGLSETNYGRVISLIASYCTSTAACLSAHQSVGAVEPLLRFGSEEQKQTYLPRMAKGALSAFALTEAEAGSDPSEIRTTATLDEPGEYYIINGEKLWCTNGPNAELVVVLALTPRSVRGHEKQLLTAFLVETETPGFEVTHQSVFSGVRGISDGVLRFRDMSVPAANVLGRPGQGLKLALTSLNSGRMAVPMATTAAAKLSTCFARDWARSRVQWGAPIGKHQGIASKLASMAAETYAMESMTMVMTALADAGDVDIRMETAAAKCFASEAVWRIVDDLVQIRGGRGLETAESLARRGDDPVPAERLLRDVRLARIIEGTNEILRLFMAREAISVHLRQVGPLLAGKRLHSFWTVLMFYLRWYPRQLISPPLPKDIQHLGPRNRGHVVYLARTCKQLARAILHALIRHRHALEHEQLALYGLVDAAVDLFAMTCVLSRTEQLLKKGEVDTAEAEHLADFFCTRARRRITDNLKRIRHNDGAEVSRIADALMNGQFDWLAEGVFSEAPQSFLSAASAVEREERRRHRDRVDAELAEEYAALEAEEASYVQSLEASNPETLDGEISSPTSPDGDESSS